MARAGLGGALPALPGRGRALVPEDQPGRRATATATAGAPPAAAGWRPLAGGFWRFTAPRAFAQICQTAFQRADIVLVAALSSPREAAVYTAATRFIVISQLVTQAVQNVMQPAVSG